jgi:hypothetical protein
MDPLLTSIFLGRDKLLQVLDLVIELLPLNLTLLLYTLFSKLELIALFLCIFKPGVLLLIFPGDLLAATENFFQSL